MKKRVAKKTGPKPERVKIRISWKKAIKKVLSKQMVKEGTAKSSG